ncbi:hypothetical protein CY34DRAFT_218519 [Suillus luteus UH-Slu-Lm8-n1]|uniref:Uncharacterized protein n=1 Tax=Suillus luteus UH-Slu-Lm8-n1 TaxID=930992 RepID=A0A0D0ATH5_9AGAM|nr:hypothetical protein CY34DRAFT_218519 [Suillus luteus UH-Slu-Lm8-n1]
MARAHQALSDHRTLNLSSYRFAHINTSSVPQSPNYAPAHMEFLPPFLVLGPFIVSGRIYVSLTFVIEVLSCVAHHCVIYISKFESPSMSAVTRLFSFSANSTVDASAVFLKCHPRHLEPHTTLAVSIPIRRWAPRSDALARTRRISRSIASLNSHESLPQTPPVARVHGAWTWHRSSHPHLHCLFFAGHRTRS